MKTIHSRNYRDHGDDGEFLLSDELYEITEWDAGFIPLGYDVGTKVRLIGSSIEKIGAHWSKEHSTICRIDAEFAEFIGIKKEFLRLVSVEPVFKKFDLLGCL